MKLCIISQKSCDSLAPQADGEGRIPRQNEYDSVSILTPISTSRYTPLYRSRPSLPRLPLFLAFVFLFANLLPVTYATNTFNVISLNTNGLANLQKQSAVVNLITAKQLVEDGRVLDEAGQCYHDAVQACLTHQIITDTEVKGLSSKHVNFQSDLEKFVVAPIRDSYAASWGQVSVS